MEKRNKIERLKASLSAKDFLQKLHEVDWNAPSESDRFYLKNYGIYNIKLRPEKWMLRLRFDGGSPTAMQLQHIAKIAQRYQLEILLTSRAQIELHALSPDTIYPIWQQLNRDGLPTYQTLTDNFRALVSDPLDGLTPDSKITTAPIISAIKQSIYGASAWLGTLPRKFNTAIIGRETPSFNPWSNDLLFALALREGQWGFNLYLGGKNGEVAQDADIFCLPEAVPALFLAVASCYREYGLRGSRAKVRLFHLLQEVGMTQLRYWIALHYSAPLLHAGTLQMRSSSANQDHLLSISRHGCYGEITPQTLASVAQQAQKKRSLLRLTPHQELWMINTPLYTTPRQNPSQIPTVSVTACAGARYCPLSLWDIKKDLPSLPLQALRTHGISLGFSGCLKGCGRHYYSHLGLIGLRTSNYGCPERALRIFLGAVEHPSPTPARMLYYAVPVRAFEALVTVILEDYRYSGYTDFETFSHRILRYYSITLLQLWYMVRQYYPKSALPYEAFFKLTEEELLIADITALEDFPEAESLYDRMRILSHRLWDIQ